MKWTKTIIGALLAVLLLAIARERYTATDLTTRVNELEQERTRLAAYVQRLSSSHRVAQVTVLDQMRDERGRPVTTLRWQEISGDGVVGEPREVEVVGRLIYFEAYVVKFDHDLVASADPDRGASVALFRRIFGEGQAPESAEILHPLASAHGSDEGIDSTGAAALWRRFWELVDSPDLASQFGVRVAQCEAPAVQMQTGQTWEVTLDAPGGLNLRRLRDPAHLARSTPD